ncbi:hypothetical protein, partial [Rathayibacter sp. AY1H3]|uniref:hypothetical protein n=1 Tax=Rathayibacter sp. AY1H3 TaxID=2080567 RepID=UPI000D4D122A
REIGEVFGAEELRRIGPALAIEGETLGLEELAQIGRTALTTAIPVLAFQGGFDTTQIGALFAALGVTMLVLATATAIVGVIGVARKDRARLLSAVTLGVGASVAIVELGALVVPPLVGLSLQY